jgi:hypothetical protein
MYLYVREWTEATKDLFESLFLDEGEKDGCGGIEHNSGGDGLRALWRTRTSGS